MQSTKSFLAASGTVAGIVLLISCDFEPLGATEDLLVVDVVNIDVQIDMEAEGLDIELTPDFTEPDQAFIETAELEAEGIFETGEYSEVCDEACMVAMCGNCTCEPWEDASWCKYDCGWCGDGFCGCEEQTSGSKACPNDCEQ